MDMSFVQGNKRGWLCCLREARAGMGVPRTDFDLAHWSGRTTIPSDGIRSLLRKCMKTDWRVADGRALRLKAERF